MAHTVDIVKSKNCLQEFWNPGKEHGNDFKVFSTIDKTMKYIICFKKSVWSVCYMGNYRYLQDTFLLHVIFTLWADLRANPPCYLFAYSYYCLSCVFRYNIMVIICLNIIYYSFDIFEFVRVDMKCYLSQYQVSEKFHILEMLSTPLVSKNV